MGISKKALLNDYYMDEIGEIIHEYSELHKIDKKEEGPEQQETAESFFNFF